MCEADREDKNIQFETNYEYFKRRQQQKPHPIPQVNDTKTFEREGEATEWK